VKKAKVWAFAGIFCLLAALLLFGFDAMAQQSLGDAASTIGDETISPIGKLLVKVFALVGLALVGIGIVKLINAKKHNEPIGSSIGMVAGGAILTAILVFVGLTTQSAIQTDATGLDDIGLGNP